MSHKIAKKIRRELFSQGVAIKAEPYTKTISGNIIASGPRRMYQKMKQQKGKI